MTTDFDGAKIYKGPILVTVTYFVMYYGFLIYQSAMKHRLYYLEKQKEKSTDKKPSYKEIKYFSSNKWAITVDRTVGNALEQQSAFLCSLWLCAFFASVDSATFYGALYVFFRTLYPFVFPLGGGWILLSTLPGYMLIFTMLWMPVSKALL